MMNGEMNKNMCKCPHHKVGPWAFIVIGLLVILQSFGLIGGVWPMLLVGILFAVIGVVKLSGNKCKCCSK